MPTISYHALNGRVSSTTAGAAPSATSPSIGGGAPLNWSQNGAFSRTLTTAVDCCESLPTPDRPAPFCDETETVLT